jgi:signal transduction histidine kinase
MKLERDRSMGSIAPIKVSKLQYLFAAIAVIALISLGASSILESRTAGTRSKILSDIETPAASIIFSQRETLVYATKLALWSNGGTTRREVQIARNLLAQRLAVVDSSGKSMGERASASYWRALKAADELVAAAPMGILPESLHRDTNKILLPVIDQILAAARDLVVSYQKSVDREMEIYARETAQRDSFNLLLLYLFIISGSLALLLNIRGNFKNYQLAREALASEIERLDATQERLAEAERTVTQLIDLDTAKNSLISTVNHELRTPLTSIIGYIDLLRRDISSKKADEVANYLEVLERNSHILLRLVESLLSLSKFDGQEGRLPDEVVDLQGVLDSAIFTVTPTAAATSLKISINPSIPALVKGDVGQLNQVFINLLANAIKFSPSQSEILISMRKATDSTIEIAIADQGIGIAEEDIPRIFTRFYRAKNVESQGFEGFGLGLAIVQQAIEHHGGDIKVESIIGKGSTFIVTLPLIERGEEL